MSSKALDREAVNDFVASAKMNETTFSRSGIGNTMDDRVLKA